MKIVFIGGVKFSYEILSHILKKGWKISACFTYKETKKKIYSDMVSFDDLLSKYHIKHIKVDNINDEKNIKILKKIKPDLILIMGWSQLLKSEIIKIPKLGVIGSHPTELPKFRGRAPIPWSIIKGLKKSALTFFYIEKGIDDGDILDQEKFEITPSDDATTIYQKVISKGKKMIIKNLKLIKNGKVKRKKQNKKLKLGICGEHGGDPKSILFCSKIGLNYVSCSPFRVPIARLAAAQAALLKD